MKILQLGKFYPVRGGVEKVMYDLMLGLSARSVDCDMLCALSKGGSQVLDINGHARLIGCHAWLKAYATMLSPAMISALHCRCEEYDIIHVHHPAPMACLALLLSRYKGKVVLHWHADIEKQKVLLKFYMPLQRWLLKRADVIVGTTPVYTAESPFLTRMQSKVKFLPIGIEPVPACPEQTGELLRRYPGKKIIFSLGRLVEYKGYRYLIEAARYLEDDYVVLIGGSGPLERELRVEIEAWGVGEKVKLLGRISDEELPAYYRACTLFCLSSIQKTEAFGIVQIEAMSCGKPVVATRIPHSGVAWVNEHGVSGLNVVPKDATELADAIRTIAGDELAYRKFSAGAEKRYREMFTKDKMINDVLDIYKKLWMKQELSQGNQ